MPSSTESGSSTASQTRTPRGNPDLINLELEQGLLRARFCRARPGLGNVDDLRKAKAAYDRALELLGQQKNLRKWQRRRLEGKLARLQRCIREVEIATLAGEFSPAQLVLMGTSDPLGHKLPS